MGKRSLVIWMAVALVVAAAGPPAEIVVPDGFVVNLLYEQPNVGSLELEAIRNPDYGFGVMAASVNDGVLTVLRISESEVVEFGTIPGFPQDSWLYTLRFDGTGLFGRQLYASVAVPGDNSVRTDFVRFCPSGESTVVGSVGGPGDYVGLLFDFTTGDEGYLPGAYLEDQVGDPGTSLHHMDCLFNFTELGSEVLPPGRTDLDIRGMEFDPTGLYDSYLTMADCDLNSEGNLYAAIYKLLPDLSWEALTDVVDSGTRCYLDLAFSPGGSFDPVLYVAERVDEKVMTVGTEGAHGEFASGFTDVASVTISDDGENMFVSDAIGVYRIRAETTEVGPTLVMREPWVEADDVHTGPSGVDSLRLLWSQRILFDNEDVSITNEDAEPVQFSVSGSNSQFMIIAFGDVLFNDKYTITIHDSVVSAVTGAAIDGDNDGVAGGDAVLEMEHRRRPDFDNNGGVGPFDLAMLLGDWGP